MILFYDTETTGLPPRNARPDQQPRLVQLGAIITDDVGNELAAVDLLVRPEGFTIPEPASRVHGIVTDMALAAGIPVRTALGLFQKMWSLCEITVGHNVEYDQNIMLGEFHRANAEDFWTNMCLENEVRCTALLSEPVIKLPPTERMIRFGYGPYKKPNLAEAHQYFLGEGFAGAHSALADVRACARVYWAMVKGGHIV